MNDGTPSSAPPAYDAETAAALKLWTVLARAFHSVSEEARRSVERHGLGGSEFGVLELLYHKGRLSLGEVGERILLTSGSTTYVIDKLEARGLVRRAACPDDRRVCYVELTPEGEALIGTVFPAHARRVREITDGLSVEEKREAAELLKRLGRGVRERG
ncbi:MAG TPA: MarR family transcriptional regulator [Longimicrobiaceae bacterium]|nr:MarR family transcriptional regulator [Longimicrobiaceae bacterium]